jgi:F0F1-type ATP synthase membrane subunit b/b'
VTIKDLWDRLVDLARRCDDSFRARPLHRLNSYAFLTVFLLGLLFISFFNPSDFAQARFLQVYWFGMCVIMGLYLAFCFRYMRRVPGAEDYVYYMGFMFTLTGLALSLVKITETGNTKIIVGYFGVALTSTIIGVTYRVLLIQAHHDLETTIDGELNKAADSARSLVDELRATNTAFSRLRKQTEKAAASAGDKMVADAQAMSEELQAVLKDFSEQSTRQMDETTRGLAQTSDRIQQELQTTSALLRDQLIGHAQQFSDRMSATAEAVPQQVNAVFGRVGAEMEAAARRVSENLVAAAETLPNELQAISVRLGQAAEQNLGEVTRQVSEVVQSLSRELQKVYDDLRKQTERQAAEIAATLMAQTEPLSDGLREIAEQMSGIVKNIGDESSSVAQGLQELNDAAARARASLEQLRSPGKLIEVEFAPLSASLEKTVGSLREIIDSHARQMYEVEKAIAAWHQEEMAKPVTLEAMVGLWKAERRRTWWRRLFTIVIALLAMLLAADSPA